jgi:flagella basal body P-ring formation protein FlgA
MANGWIASGLRIAALAVLALFIVAKPAGAAGHQLPVPRITLYPGELIRSDHLIDRLFNARGLSHSAFYRSRDDIIGKVARRTLLPGQPIPVNALRDPYLVVQGRTVQIVYRDGALTITGYAVALESGSEGAVIRVRNIDSGAIVKGIVESDGSVRVGGS